MLHCLRVSMLLAGRIQRIRESKVRSYWQIIYILTSFRAAPALCSNQACWSIVACGHWGNNVGADLPAFYTGV